MNKLDFNNMIGWKIKWFYYERSNIMDRNTLQETIDVLNDIADKLYQGYVNEGMADMNKIISNLAVISTWIVDEDLTNRLISDALSPILEAMEEQDGTGLADLITYELLEILEAL